MKNKRISIDRRAWIVPGIVAGLLIVGVGLGVGVGALFKAKPAPPPIAEALQSPHMGDDGNGPPEVIPPVLVPTPVPVPVPEASPPAAQTSGAPAWMRYAVPVKALAGKPMIAVVIDDLGLDKRRTRRAMDLSPPLTMAFLTYADDLPEQTALAREHGHELLVHMPMQAMSSHFNAGPNVLEVGMSATELHHRIAWGLDRFGFASR